MIVAYGYLEVSFSLILPEPHLDKHVPYLSKSRRSASPARVSTRLDAISAVRGACTTLARGTSRARERPRKCRGAAAGGLAHASPSFGYES